MSFDGSVVGFDGGVVVWVLGVGGSVVVVLLRGKMVLLWEESCVVDVVVGGVIVIAVFLLVFLFLLFSFFFSSYVLSFLDYYKQQRAWLFHLSQCSTDLNQFQCSLL